jgi:hypothetical protein
MIAGPAVAAVVIKMPMIRIRNQTPHMPTPNAIANPLNCEKGRHMQQIPAEPIQIDAIERSIITRKVVSRKVCTLVVIDPISAFKIESYK